MPFTETCPACFKRFDSAVDPGQAIDCPRCKKQFPAGMPIASSQELEPGPLHPCTAFIRDQFTKRRGQRLLRVLMCQDIDTGVLSPEQFEHLQAGQLEPTRENVSLLFAGSPPLVLCFTVTEQGDTLRTLEECSLEPLVKDEEIETGEDDELAEDPAGLLKWRRQARDAWALFHCNRGSRLVDVRTQRILFPWPIPRLEERIVLDFVEPPPGPYVVGSIRFTLWIAASSVQLVGIDEEKAAGT